MTRLKKPLDNIFVFTPGLETHRRHVCQILSCLQENCLCLFRWTSLPSLSYAIYDRGLLIDPQKQSAVLNWPCSVGLCAIQFFLGFVNYYIQFILHFFTLVTPISVLTKKGNNPKIWSSEAVDASGKAIPPSSPLVSFLLLL